jgi:hypothetical protein
MTKAAPSPQINDRTLARINRSHLLIHELLDVYCLTK